jgi:hypothetical protein
LFSDTGSETEFLDDTVDAFNVVSGPRQSGLHGIDVKRQLSPLHDQMPDDLFPIPTHLPDAALR